MTDVDELRRNIRETVLGFLRTVGSDRSLQHYWLSVGVGIGEIYCQWFDDMYHPEDAVFRSAFSSEALEAFEEVTRALRNCETRIGGLSIPDVVQTEWWDPVRLAAQRALAASEKKPRE